MYALDLGLNTMKPNDEDVTPPPEDIPEDVDTVEAEIEDTFRPRKQRSRYRRTKTQEYGSLASLIAWMAFTVIWLFFFASGYGIFENIAVVFVALLVVIAVNAVAWIPRMEGGWKARTSAASGLIWIIFLIVWIVFFAVDYGIYENLGIALASLLIIGAVNMILWMSSAGEEGRARISALGGIGWLTFMVLWLPFANDFALIYPINVYQNVAIILTSFIIMLLIVIAPWGSGISVDIDPDTPGLANRLKGTMALFILWLVFLVIWMWFLAGNPLYAFSGNQNVAATLLSFAIFCAIIVGMWLPWSRKRGEGPENWFAIGLAFVWVIVLAFWFWFLADSFNAYQNFAVFLVSLLIMAAISGGTQWKKYRDFEAMDWDD
jgi:hypothetical protein